MWSALELCYIGRNESKDNEFIATTLNILVHHLEQEINILKQDMSLVEFKCVKSLSIHCYAQNCPSIKQETTENSVGKIDKLKQLIHQKGLIEFSEEEVEIFIDGSIKKTDERSRKETYVSKMHMSSDLIALQFIDIDSTECDHLESCFEFLSWVEQLAHLSHPHIAKIVGYAFFKSNKACIFSEYSDRGTLDECLFDKDLHVVHPKLSFKKKIRICIDIASALSFLHGNRISCGYFMNSMIGIDKFGRATLLLPCIEKFSRDISRSIIQWQETVTLFSNYIDPLIFHHLNRQCLIQCDSYSFGIALLELYLEISAHQLDMAEVMNRLSQYDISLCKPGHKDGGIIVVDIIEVIVRCLELNFPQKRPLMAEIENVMAQIYRKMGSKTGLLFIFNFF